MRTVSSRRAGAAIWSRVRQLHQPTPEENFMSHRLATSLFAIVLVGVLASPGISQGPAGQSSQPDPASIISHMKQALDPATPSVRVMTLKVTGPRATVQWRMAQARGEANGSKWMLTVMLLPSSWGKGIALLDEDNPSSSAASEYIYLPAVQRVRRFTPLQGWEPFFGSDFSYQDFSFPRFGLNATLKGKETHNDTESYRLEETLSNNPYYSKIVSWVATETGLPVERNYYDLSGKLYKSERFEHIVTIQNVPTITKVMITDVQMDRSSEINVTSVKYNKEAPISLFDPNNLPNAAANQFWKSAM
jgi:outer membrane lipoprotein-sorting protein